MLSWHARYARKHKCTPAILADDLCADGNHAVRVQLAHDGAVHQVFDVPLQRALAGAVVPAAAADAHLDKRETVLSKLLQCSRRNLNVRALPLLVGCSLYGTCNGR